MKHHFAVGSSFIALTVLGSAIGGTLAIALAHLSTGSPSRPVLTMDRPPASTCGQNQTPIGYIAYLKPGQTVTTLASQGLAATQLTQVGQLPPAVLIGPPVTEAVGSSAPQIVSQLPSGTAAYGLVYPQASEPDLVSCDYQLADKPADKAYVTAADALLLSKGFVNDQQLVTDPMFFISDDPLNRSVYIITVKVLGGPIAPPSNTPQGVTILSTVDFAVLEDAQSTAVVAFGNAPW